MLAPVASTKLLRAAPRFVEETDTSRAAIERGNAWLLKTFNRDGGTGVDIGQASALHAISYLYFRANFYEAKDPLYPDFDFSEGRPNLKAWWDEAIQRPSVTSHYNKEFDGDDSAEFCQAKVQEVLAAQRANA